MNLYSVKQLLVYIELTLTNVYIFCWIINYLMLAIVLLNVIEKHYQWYHC